MRTPKWAWILASVSAASVTFSWIVIGLGMSLLARGHSFQDVPNRQLPCLAALEMETRRVEDGNELRILEEYTKPATLEFENEIHRQAIALGFKRSESGDGVMYTWTQDRFPSISTHLIYIQRDSNKVGAYRTHSIWPHID